MKRKEEIEVVMKAIIKEVSSKTSILECNLNTEEKARFIIDKGTELQKYLNELDGSATWEYMSY